MVPAAISSSSRAEAAPQALSSGEEERLASRTLDPVASAGQKERGGREGGGGGGRGGGGRGGGGKGG